MVKHHQSKGAEATLALAKRYNISVGKAELDGMKIINFISPTSAVSIGILVLSGSMLKEMSSLQQMGQFQLRPHGRCHQLPRQKWKVGIPHRRLLV
jgi:hypothetical protein